MRIGRHAVALVTLTLVSVVILGCAGADTVPSLRQPDAETAQEQAVPALHLMAPQNQPANDERLREIVDSLNSLNPSLAISLTLSAAYEADLAVALASERPPDLFVTTASMLPALARDGRIGAIPDGWIDRSQLLRAASDAVQVDGKLACFPHSLHTLALVYNADLFEQAGIQAPNTSWDWANWAAAAKSLTDSEEGIVGLVLDPSPTIWVPLYFQAGGQSRFNSQGSAIFAPGPAQISAAYLAGLFSDGIAIVPAERDAAWSGQAFAGGDIGMTVAGDWILSYLQDNPPPFAYATAELPAGPAGRGNIAFVNCVAVHADSQHRDLALQLAQQLTAPEILAEWATAYDSALSAHSAPDVASLSDRTHMDPYLRALRYAGPWRYGSFTSDHGDRFSEGLTLVIDEELSPDEFWPYLLQDGVTVSPP